MMVTTIGIMNRADMFEAEGLMLKTVSMSYMGSSCEAKLPIISICSIGDGRWKSDVYCRAKVT
jgi:hypothetical protein